MEGKQQEEVLRVKRLREDAVIPKRADEGSAGYDLNCLESFEIAPNERKTIPIGIAIEIPDIGLYGRIAPRSSLALLGIQILGGIVDDSYRGELKVLMINHGTETKKFEKGDRIAQLVLERIAKIRVVEVDELTTTVRGAGGFGSTGK